MAILVLGLIIFLGLHSTRIFAEGGREKAIARLGEGPWKGIYSLLSVVGFVLIVWGFAEARYTAPALWHAARRGPAPHHHFDAPRDGAARRLFLQAEPYHRCGPSPDGVERRRFGLAHLISNGSAADLVLFGAFLVWAAADLVSSYARDRRNGVVYPEPKWSATAGALVVGLAFWAVLAFWLHYRLFGVSPLGA